MTRSDSAAGRSLIAALALGVASGLALGALWSGLALAALIRTGPPDGPGMRVVTGGRVVLRNADSHPTRLVFARRDLAGLPCTGSAPEARSDPCHRVEALQP